MFWTAGLVLVALAIGQVPAELAEPVFIEDALSKAVASGDSRIVSGWEAYPGQHPHQASLRNVDAQGGVTGCGGSVVHREWVISAAHCTAARVTIVVRAGVTSLTTPQYMFETTQWWNHPTYDESRPGIVQANDISILKLQRPLVYTSLLQPIRIQRSMDAFNDYDNQVVVASGWGRIWTDGAQPEILNWVYLRAISNAACRQTFGAALINDNAICARWYNVTSQSVCQGDSGGPLVHVSLDGTASLVGIASFVAGGDFGCHSGLPAGFIRPGPFIPWLNDITGLDFDNLEEEDEVTEAPTVPTTEPTPPPTTEATEPPTTAPTETPEPTPEPTVPTTRPTLPPTTEIPEPPTTPPTETPEPTPEPTVPTTETTLPPTTEIPEPPTTQTILPTETTPEPTREPTLPTTTWTPEPPPESTPLPPPGSTGQPPTEDTKPPTDAPEPPTEVTQPTTELTTTETPRPPTPEPDSEEEEDSSESGSEEDPEMSELLKKLIVKVKVKVKINNNIKKKVKVKCVDKIKHRHSG